MSRARSGGRLAHARRSRFGQGVCAHAIPFLLDLWRELKKKTSWWELMDWVTLEHMDDAFVFWSWILLVVWPETLEVYLRGRVLVSHLK